MTQNSKVLENIERNQVNHIHCIMQSGKVSANPVNPTVQTWLQKNVNFACTNGEHVVVAIQDNAQEPWSSPVVYRGC